MKLKKMFFSCFKCVLLILFFVNFLFAETQNLQFVKGWNLKGSALDNVSVEKIGNENQITTVWQWSGTGWNVWSPVESIKNLLTNYGIKNIVYLSSGEGFWVNSGLEYSSVLEGNISSSDKLVFSNGWNLLSPKSITGLKVSNLTGKPVNTVWQWSGTGWNVWSPLPSLQTLLANYGITEVVNIGFGEGFWLNATDSGTIDNQTFTDNTSSSDNETVNVSFDLKKVISAGSDGHTLAVAASGEVYSWGRNHHGQLGDGTFVNHIIPDKVDDITNIVSVSANWAESYALTELGEVYAWGYNYYGELGDGTTDDSAVPVKIKDLKNIAKISAGQNFLIALTKDGNVFSLGYNGDGELGDGTTDDSAEPVQVNSVSNVVDVSTCCFHVLALTKDGEIYAWGNN